MKDNIIYKWILYLLNNSSSNCYSYKSRLHNLLVFSSLLYYRKYNKNILSIDIKISKKGFTVENLDEFLVEMEKSELIAVRYGIYGVYIVPLVSWDNDFYTKEELNILDVINNTINQLSSSLLENYAINNLSWSKDKLNTIIKLSDISIGEFIDFIYDEDEYIEADDFVEEEGKKDLYVITTVSLKKRLESDIRKEYEIYKIKYPVWKLKTYENFCEFLKSWNWYDYTLSQEDNSYFFNLSEAKDRVIHNIGHINDGGIYNYVVIKKVPIEKIHANSDIKEYYLFIFNKNIGLYEEVTIDDNEEIKYILDNILYYQRKNTKWKRSS